jgi:hypothetical protein
VDFHNFELSDRKKLARDYRSIVFEWSTGCQCAELIPSIWLKVFGGFGETCGYFTRSTETFPTFDQGVISAFKISDVEIIR